MELRFDHIDDLVFLLQEPPATAQDRRFVIPRLQQLADFGDAIFDVVDVDGVSNLRELVIEWDHRFGFLLRPRDWGYQAVAYWRSPALPGFERSEAVNKALSRES